MNNNKSTCNHLTSNFIKTFCLCDKPEQNINCLLSCISSLIIYFHRIPFSIIIQRLIFRMIVRRANTLLIITPLEAAVIQIVLLFVYNFHWNIYKMYDHHIHERASYQCDFYFFKSSSVSFLH